VLENDAEYDRWKIERRNLTRSSRDRAAQQAVRDRLEQMRSKTQAAIGPNSDPTKPAASAADSAVRPSPQAIPASNPQPIANRDLNVPSRPTFNGGGGGGGGGGGAVDPLSIAVLLGLGAAGIRRRKHRAAQVA
jgi:Ca-activated chloride channel homolog